MKDPRWCGVPGSFSHRTTGERRAWCLGCGEWCYAAMELRCRCCEGGASDPVVAVLRSTLLRWARAVVDEEGLDAVASEMRRTAEGER